MLSQLLIQIFSGARFNFRIGFICHVLMILSIDQMFATPIGLVTDLSVSVTEGN